jgi:hydrophobe/amphiphile efflux-1 (HAE1) family protein
MFSLSKVKDAFIFMLQPPPIRELGNASGFEMQLIDLGGLGHEKLMAARNQLLGMAAQNKMVMAVRPNGLNDVPQYSLEINYNKASALGIDPSDIVTTLTTAWGSSYINEFLDNGKTKKVYVQGDAEHRMLPEDVGKWFVRNKNGDMVSFNSFTEGKWTYGSPSLERFNGVSSINIQGSAAPGVSSGVAMQEMEKMAASLPKGIGVTWSGLSYEEREATGNSSSLYILSMLIVFLSLAALYESWSIPFSVMLVIPFGILGALIASKLGGKPNDIYFQVALLTTIGLSAKNAILIVEFAKDLYEDGHDLLEATVIAIKQRFRPILMTSMAFMLGVIPLAISSGAGSASQNALGIAVLGGMFASTFFAPFFVPLFYILTQRKRKSKPKNDIM